MLTHTHTNIHHIQLFSSLIAVNVELFVSIIITDYITDVTIIIILINFVILNI